MPSPNPKQLVKPQEAQQEGSLLYQSCMSQSSSAGPSQQGSDNPGERTRDASPMTLRRILSARERHHQTRSELVSVLPKRDNVLNTLRQFQSERSTVAPEIVKAREQVLRLQEDPRELTNPSANDALAEEDTRSELPLHYEFDDDDHSGIPTYDSVMAIIAEDAPPPSYESLVEWNSGTRRIETAGKGQQSSVSLPNRPRQTPGIPYRGCYPPIQPETGQTKNSYNKSKMTAAYCPVRSMLHMMGGWRAERHTVNHNINVED
ncbi:hypothetical protein IAR50_006654 [Cryptococcus sp. DSM 104548]